MNAHAPTCPNCGWLLKRPNGPVPDMPPEKLVAAIRDLFGPPVPWQNFKVPIADVRRALGIPEEYAGGMRGAALRAALENYGFVVYKTNGVMTVRRGNPITADWLKLSS